MGNNHQYPPHPSLIREGVTHVVLSNNLCQSLVCYSGGATQAVHDIENLCTTRVSDGTVTFPLSPQSLPRGRKAEKLSSLKKKAAFTLAEVLITLGIIGVVAAMTMPVLIQNYRNTVVETRLKKIYTVMNQAITLAENDYGDRAYWYEDLSGTQFDKDGNIVPGSSEAEKWFNKYLVPYMKIMKTEELSDGTFMVYFPDGSALQQVYSSSSRDWYFYTSNAKKCASNTPEHANGICRFTFAFKPVGEGNAWKYHYGKGFEPCKYLWDGSKDMLYRGCESQVGDAILHGMCTALIQYNGWKIPKDYPQRIRF